MAPKVAIVYVSTACNPSDVMNYQVIQWRNIAPADAQVVIQEQISYISMIIQVMAYT